MVSDSGHKSFLPNLRSELKHDLNKKDRSERDILFDVPPRAPVLLLAENGVRTPAREVLAKILPCRSLGLSLGGGLDLMGPIYPDENPSNLKKQSLRIWRNLQ